MARRRLLMLPIAIVLGYAVLLCITLWAEHRQTERDAERNQVNSVRLIEVLVAQAVNPIDQVVRALVRHAGVFDLYAPAPFMPVMPQIVGAAAIDAKGGKIFGDDMLLQWLRSLPTESEDALSVSPPRRLEDGTWAMVFSRPIVTDEGVVLGKVGVLTPARRFAEFFDAIDDRAYGEISIARLDGTILARTPGIEIWPGAIHVDMPLLPKNMQAGSGGVLFVPSGAGSPEARLLAYQKVQNADMVVTVTRDWSDIFKVWRQSATVFAVMGVFMAGAMVSLSVRLLRGLQRQQEAESARRAAEAARAELHRLATTDGLTGVLNRRAFLDTATTEIARSHRYGRPMSVVMVDIDHFKAINDTYGHAAGDEALRRVAQAAEDALRTEDRFGRIGGEEFAAMLPETDAARAMMIAERLRDTISRVSIELNDNVRFGVTASFGVASLQSGERTMDATLQRADEALYAAKRSGRNRVVSAG
jgi:diguanylate cyclase (GGDEF)-like protein